MLLSGNELEQMRKSCALAADTLNFVDTLIEEGISTEKINQKVYDFIVSAGAYPSPLHYKGFPKSICASKNNVMCHGIPNKNEILMDGDIINIDITTYLPQKNGFHGDTSATFLVGSPTQKAKHITKIAYECLLCGIEAAKPGVCLYEIGASIENIANKNGCSVSPDFVGHGIGKEFHTSPSIRHIKDPFDTKIIEEGMIFTIEPIVNLGSPDYKIQNDGWTVLTSDGSLSAQFEHTILITKDGNEILTKRNKKLLHSIE